MNRAKVYIAGPYSSNPHANVGIAVAWWHQIYEAGGDPFVPHLSHFVDQHKPGIDYESWMQLDLRWLKSCDALFRFEGCSKGADREVLAAIEMDKVVFHEHEFGQLKQWLKEVAQDVAGTNY